jgi:hypothetical protein
VNLSVWAPGRPAWMIVCIGLVAVFFAAMFWISYLEYRRGFNLQRMSGRASIAIGALLLAVSAMLWGIPVWFPLIFGGGPILIGVARLFRLRTSESRQTSNGRDENR